MSLPKLYSPVSIEFLSLRSGLGGGGGVIFDIDTKVTRKCMRVISGDSWCWQIVNYEILKRLDYLAVVDQEVLIECGPEVEFSIASDKSEC